MVIARQVLASNLKKDLAKLKKNYYELQKTAEYKFLIKGYIPSLQYPDEQVLAYILEQKDETGDRHLYQEILQDIEKDQTSIKEYYCLFNKFSKAIEYSLQEIKYNFITQKNKLKIYDSSVAETFQLIQKDFLAYKDQFMQIGYERTTSLVNSCNYNISKIDDLFEKIKIVLEKSRLEIENIKIKYPGNEDADEVAHKHYETEAETKINAQDQAQIDEKIRLLAMKFRNSNNSGGVEPQTPHGFFGKSDVITTTDFKNKGRVNRLVRI